MFMVTQILLFIFELFPDAEFLFAHTECKMPNLIY